MPGGSYTDTSVSEFPSNLPVIAIYLPLPSSHLDTSEKGKEFFIMIPTPCELEVKPACAINL